MGLDVGGLPSRLSADGLSLPGGGCQRHTGAGEKSEVKATAGNRIPRTKAKSGRTHQAKSTPSRYTFLLPEGVDL